MLRIFFFALFLPFLFGGCAKENQGPGFDLIYREQFEMPAGIGPFVVHHFYLRNIPTRYQQLLTQQGKTDADVTGVVTVQGNLSGVFGDANFNVVSQVSIRVFQENDPDDYIEVAYREPVPLEPGNNLGLIPTLADSKRMVSESRMSIDVVIWLRSTTQDNIPVQLDLQLKATL